MKCWKCQTEVTIPSGRVPFRAVCEKCHSWLHVCKSCRNFKPGAPNDCLVPGTELITDREAANYCEEYQYGRHEIKEGPSPEDVAKRLFKD